MDKITINGVEYVPAQSQGDIRIVVLDRGFVYVGHYKLIDGEVHIRNARNLIRWGTKAHLGELVYGPLESTKLGANCDVVAPIDRLIHTIEVSQNGWRDSC